MRANFFPLFPLRVGWLHVSQSEGQRWHMRSSGCEMSFMISTTFLKQPVLSESDLPPFDGSPCARQSRQPCKQHNPRQFRARSLVELRLRFVDSSLPASARFLRAGRKIGRIIYLKRIPRGTAPQTELINTQSERYGLQTWSVWEICSGLVPPSVIL